jgi:hypothetical protein
MRRHIRGSPDLTKKSKYNIFTGIDATAKQSTGGNESDGK